jgi:hypothetical protein
MFAWNLSKGAGGFDIAYISIGFMLNIISTLGKLNIFIAYLFSSKNIFLYSFSYSVFAGLCNG